MNRVDGSPREAGMITAFVVALAGTFLVAAGLAVDSGRIVAARITAADHAENAARIGAQQLRDPRHGDRVIDPARAQYAAMQYLNGHGVSGEVRADLDSVQVSTYIVREMTLLRLIGVPHKRVSVTRSAHLVDE